MKKKDHKSIAYLFKEMDPSEEVEFERSLQDNENLLIEVESLRKVNEKLSSLPHFSAPAHLIEEISSKARKKTAKPRMNWIKPFYLATAAIVMVGFTGSILFMDSTSSEQDSASDHAVVGSTNMIYSDQEEPGALSESKAKITPWIDNNDILHFNERLQNPESAQIDSMLKDSYQRLTPVTDPIQSRMLQRNLQLTGSQ
ncbi:MAG: hypothetical protein EA390_14840 [Balneolaceae bacterium]|nr:MAG: hypothetical protein EA390_14840 [Balneolaceae bacterium]